MGALWADCKEKNCNFEVLSSYSIQQSTISRLDCDLQWKVDFIRQPVMTSSVVGLRRCSKALPKAKLAPKKVKSTVWWSIAHLIHYIFMNPAKLLHRRSVLSKSMRCTKNCNAPISQPNGPNSSPDNSQSHITQPTLKSWTNWATKFCLIGHIHLTSRQLLQASQTLFQGKHFQNQEEEENGFQEFTEFWSTDFYTIGINKLISHWQKIYWL